MRWAIIFDRRAEMLRIETFHSTLMTGFSLCHAVSNEAEVQGQRFAGLFGKLNVETLRLKYRNDLETIFFFLTN